MVRAKFRNMDGINIERKKKRECARYVKGIWRMSNTRLEEWEQRRGKN